MSWWAFLTLSIICSVSGLSVGLSEHSVFFSSFFFLFLSFLTAAESEGERERAREREVIHEVAKMRTK